MCIFGEKIAGRFELSNMKKFTIEPEMRANYIAIAILSFVVLIVINVNLFGNFSRKSDLKLEAEIKSQRSKIDAYAQKQRKLPDTVLDAGIEESDGVEYKKVSDSKYLLCADFKTKSDGYNYDRYYDDFDGALTIGAGLDASESRNTKFQKGDTYSVAHDEGYNCFVYEPSIVSRYSSGVEVCNKTYKSRKPSQYIQSVDLINKTIVVSNENNSAATVVPTPVTYYLSTTAIYNINCVESDISSLSAGMGVDIYFDTYRSSTDSTPVALKVI